ncbi:beta-lactamase family protein [Streptomyces sp. RS10V-4]|uniref:serine hydrolase domain-containing protein n=1 Tax=Streptomyces rhizoryzae TaxID=2932493 RepID=UPI0020069463|nr:serine hydrolase domain-containing protein [Streptomyces rhizoryzae]MCK7626380.1 beta-lactamase family protein [Streptomyces rhizoryzae]
MARKLGRARLAATLGAACALLLVLPPAAQAAPAASDAHADTLAALKAFQSAAGPGAGVYAGDATNSWSLSAGTGTINTNAPIQPNEHYRIGSQTKTFTAATVLQLVDEGKVSLDASIEKYLPGVVDGNGYDGNAITVRHLLHQTSGIAVYEPLSAPPASNPDGSYSLEALVREGLKRAPASAPGTAFLYSNTNYLILGMLVEKATGMPVYKAVTNRISTPLGLTQTIFPAPGDHSLPTPSVRGYHGVRIGGYYFWSRVVDYDPSLFSSAGAMISTEEDLTKFYRALIGGKVVSPAALAEMEKTAGAEGVGGGYGLGLIRRDLPCGGSAWGHNGMVPGYHTQTMVTADGRHVSVVTNAYLATNVPSAQMDKVLTTALCENR